MKRLILLTMLALALISCASPTREAVDTPASTDTPQANLPNPASVFCQQQGYQSEIRTAADGSQSGACLFPDGSECDEWTFYRGECKPKSAAPTSTAMAEISSDWKTYRNDILGYSFQYPAQAEITNNDDPLKSLYIAGPGLGNESWTISHPSDREDYRPVEGVNLLQWLTDHNLLGDPHVADIQIAGTSAIHLRHDPSPQSYAFDRYYFANAGQLYQVTIGHSGATEDWDLNNRFLQSFRFAGIVSGNVTPTALPTAFPINAADYQGWWTYTHTVYGFSIMLPEDWVVVETTTFDPLMNGHTLMLQPRREVEKNSIRMSFRRTGEDAPLWPTGVGSIQFVSQGTLEVAGQPAQRVLLVCPGGEVTAIWYQSTEGQANIVRGNLEFGFIFSTTGYCEAGSSLTGKIQLMGEMIIASLKTP